jgi:hypothetical protein
MLFKTRLVLELKWTCANHWQFNMTVHGLMIFQVAGFLRAVEFIF